MTPLFSSTSHSALHRLPKTGKAAAIALFVCGGMGRISRQANFVLVSFDAIQIRLNPDHSIPSGWCRTPTPT